MFKKGTETEKKKDFWVLFDHFYIFLATGEARAWNQVKLIQIMIRIAVFVSHELFLHYLDPWKNENIFFSIKIDGKKVSAKRV